MTEAELQKNVVQLARYLGYRTYHTHFSIKSDKGWPDLVICGKGRCFFVELKDKKRAVTPDQQDWIGRLAACGFQAFIWRPQHWLDGTIERTLNPRESAQPPRTPSSHQPRPCRRSDSEPSPAA